MHKRRILLEALQAQLKALSAFAGVWIQRIPPSRQSFPCVTLFADSETVDTLTIHPQPRPQERALTVTVNAWIRGTVAGEKAGVDMDEAAAQIEAVMLKPALASDILLIATDFIADETEPEIHAVTLTYRLFYTAIEFSPTA
jgi:hypothetical protein